MLYVIYYTTIFSSKTEGGRFLVEFDRHAKQKEKLFEQVLKEEEQEIKIFRFLVKYRL